MDFDRDFGVNQVFVEDQYQRWLQNPAAVSAEWAQYCGGMHGEDPAIKQWLQQKMESTENTATLSREEKLRILARLTDAETLETFLHRKYIGKKRFSLEGGESLIPLLDWLIAEFGRLGGEELVLGMAHRGRLNVLVNVLGKGLKELFAEFEDQEVETMLGRGDVKYHLGYSTDRE